MSTGFRPPVRLVGLFGWLVLVVCPSGADADHAWGGYHWARTANPFTLQLGDNLSAAWDAYLDAASADWNASAVLYTEVVTGRTTPWRCRPTPGRVEVCNSPYGQTGWLGVAQVWVSGSHITQGTVRVNDTYFNAPPYNTPAWRRLVMCQELAHTFGLDHVDETLANRNLGTCMDYTNDPAGPPSNEHPNAHDYEALETIYAHLDGTTTLNAPLSPTRPPAMTAVDVDTPARWGKRVGSRRSGQVEVYERDFGRQYKVFTFVIWAP